MALKVYYDKDCDLGLIQKKIDVIDESLSKEEE